MTSSRWCTPARSSANPSRHSRSRTPPRRIAHSSRAGRSARPCSCPEPQHARQARTMNPHAFEDRRGLPDEYLIGKGQAWFAFVMTIGLMLVDYIDRQVIVSLFPYMKTDWGLSDKQLGALVSVVSVTVAMGALPVALLADRYSRVKSIVAMATVWSLATISCMFTRNYGQLLAARAFVGMGEAGYGSVGAALIASIFPARMRSALLAAFFAAASVGSVLGVMLGGLIAAKWGWRAAFGVF